MTRAEKRRYRRVTLDFSEQAFGRLGRLQEALDETKVGVVKQALQVLEHVVDLSERGERFLVQDRDGQFRELVVLGADRRQRERRSSA